MESPINKYKSLMNITNIKDIAYNTLFEKYIIQNKWGYDKLTEIESTDQESLIVGLNGGYPIPGLMYTFIYNPPKKDEVKVFDDKKEKKYIDYVPLVFCINVDKLKFSGINLNTLPELERVKFLQIFYKSYESFFKDVEKLTQNNKLAINKKYLQIAKSGKGQDMIKNFNDITGANFSYGYRRYNMEKVDRFRMVEFSEWDYLPFYESINAFKKLTQAQIHKLYYRTLNKNSKK